MKLVDDIYEQDALEMLLEGSKPIMRAGTSQLDYLLATPFRYHPKRGGSRFRSEIDPGVFYGAQSLRTAGAELGYWRWRFLKDAPDLKSLGPVAHTVFSCEPSCQAVDLRRPPFKKDAQLWRDASQYIQTQEIARLARKENVQAIIYESVRDEIPAWCVAILVPDVFVGIKPKVDEQVWFLSVGQTSVTLKSQGKAYCFSAAEWGL
ncbi:RES family NAD+ phosphorylase [Polynucleobacter sp. CS-Odin-A6]|uniref:RES family NAD+ phosphorylase n=1 Tax=Polynucleobacter sp. CS-Odin-A6 TaxID=2689106 RepID=UPI001C0DBACA|nr:RES family NAD+ phosphorylase [Polynucleobacter sp. CS-Odin-A6]